jgi:hypothetical protein
MSADPPEREFVVHRYVDQCLCHTGIVMARTVEEAVRIAADDEFGVDWDLEQGETTTYDHRAFEAADPDDPSRTARTERG